MREMLERFNPIVATEDPTVFRYYSVLKAMNVTAKSFPYMGDRVADRVVGYEIRLSFIADNIPYSVSHRIPIGSFIGVETESLLEYGDCIYSGMISRLFDMVVAR